MRANEKDEVRSIKTTKSAVFNERSLNMDSRIQIIEMAQFEDAKDREDVEDTLTHLRNCSKLLLE